MMPGIIAMKMNVEIELIDNPLALFQVEEKLFLAIRNSHKTLKLSI